MSGACFGWRAVTFLTERALSSRLPSAFLASRCVRIMAKFKCRLNAGAVPVPLRGAPDCEYWARFEPNRLEDCRTTNETQIIPTSLRIFQRLLRCVVESDVGTFRRICQCSMSTCPWDDIAYVMDRPEVVQFASCSSLRAKNITMTAHDRHQLIDSAK